MKNVKKVYTKPKIQNFGKMTKNTLGSGGSTIDGNNSYTQTGGGNDQR